MFRFSNSRMYRVSRIESMLSESSLDAWLDARFSRASSQDCQLTFAQYCTSKSNPTFHTLTKHRHFVITDSFLDTMINICPKMYPPKYELYRHPVNMDTIFFVPTVSVTIGFNCILEKNINPFSHNSDQHLISPLKCHENGNDQLTWKNWYLSKFSQLLL